MLRGTPVCPLPYTLNETEEYEKGVLVQFGNMTQYIHSNMHCQLITTSRGGKHRSRSEGGITGWGFLSLTQHKLTKWEEEPLVEPNHRQQDTRIGDSSSREWRVLKAFLKSHVMNCL